MDKIICVGKNYPDHAAELGETQPEEPILFLKPPSCLVQLPEAGKRETLRPKIPLPEGVVQHELEVVFRLGAPEKKEPFAAFTLGLDLTRRDLQTKLKKAGQPWEISKVFFASAIVGPWFAGTQWKTYRERPFSLIVNGERRQMAMPTEQLWSPERCIELAARYFPLREGDLLFTGTPAGVGPLKSGDALELRWDQDVIAKLDMA